MNEDSNLRNFTPQASRKRSHREISGSHSDGESQTSWSQHGESSSSVNRPGALNNSRPRLPPLPSLPQMRFPGDGFDFRRPVMSTRVSPPSFTLQNLPRGDIIDLTQDSDPTLRPARTGRREETRTNRASRGPRFGRNIMADVVDLEADSSPSSQQQQHQPSSPEVQFLGSSVRPSASQDITGNHDRSGQAHRSQFLPGGSNLMNLLRGIQRPGRPPPLDREQLLRYELSLRTRNIRLIRRVHTQPPMIWNNVPANNGIDLTMELDDVPIHLDYSTTGFVGNPPPRAEAPYNPPSAAPEGFTRTVQEDEEVICPNCEHELGTGDELRKQIWVCRPCGHVYCGTCTKNRALSSRAKKSDQSPDTKTKPFAKCVVADCGKSVSQPKAMFQVYL
ncbi:hypothetical protein MaudCBS49596_005410 [Microsporum audouinii]